MELRSRKRKISDLESTLQQVNARKAFLCASHSAIGRAWHLLDTELRTATTALLGDENEQEGLVGDEDLLLENVMSTVGEF